MQLQLLFTVWKWYFIMGMSNNYNKHRNVRNHQQSDSWYTIKICIRFALCLILLLDFTHLPPYHFTDTDLSTSYQLQCNPVTLTNMGKIWRQAIKNPHITATNQSLNTQAYGMRHDIHVQLKMFNHICSCTPSMQWCITTSISLTNGYCSGIVLLCKEATHYDVIK